MMPRMRLVLLITVSLLSAGCVRDMKPIEPSANEAALIKKIAADPFIDVIALQRGENGQLTVVTQQGDIEVTYVIKPTPDDANVLGVYRIDRDIALKIVDDASAGTGPEARGLPTKQ